MLRDGVREGQREQTAFRLACRYRHYGLPEPEALEIVLAFASAARLRSTRWRPRLRCANAYGRYEAGGPPGPPAAPAPPPCPAASRSPASPTPSAPPACSEEAKLCRRG